MPERFLPLLQTFINDSNGQKFKNCSVVAKPDNIKQIINQLQTLQYKIQRI